MLSRNAARQDARSITIRRCSLLSKLGVTMRAEAATRAKHLGIIP